MYPREVHFGDTLGEIGSIVTSLLFVFRTFVFFCLYLYRPLQQQKIKIHKAAAAPPKMYNSVLLIPGSKFLVVLEEVTSTFQCLLSKVTLLPLSIHLIFKNTSNICLFTNVPKHILHSYKY